MHIVKMDESKNKQLTNSNCFPETVKQVIWNLFLVHADCLAGFDKKEGGRGDLRMSRRAWFSIGNTQSAYSASVTVASRLHRWPIFTLPQHFWWPYNDCSFCSIYKNCSGFWQSHISTSLSQNICICWCNVNFIPVVRRRHNIIINWWKYTCWKLINLRIGILVIDNKEQKPEFNSWVPTNSKTEHCSSLGRQISDLSIRAHMPSIQNCFPIKTELITIIIALQGNYHENKDLAWGFFAWEWCSSEVTWRSSTI